jgi:hypothetical protein
MYVTVTLEIPADSGQTADVEFFHDGSTFKPETAKIRGADSVSDVTEITAWIRNPANREVIQDLIDIELEQDYQEELRSLPRGQRLEVQARNRWLDGC